MISLTDVRVDRYRSLYDFEVTLQPFTVLIGRNDAGKSSLLSALRLLLDDSASAHMDSHDWSKIGRVTRFPRKVNVSATIDGTAPQTIRRVITLEKHGRAASQLFVQDGSEWRASYPRQAKLLPS